MAINLVPVEKRSMLPITGNLGDFIVAGSSISQLILSRFPVAMARQITVRCDFIPSAALAARLAGGIAVRVVDIDGGILAESHDSSGEFRTMAPDLESRILRYPWDLLALNEELVGNLAEPEISGVVREGAVIDGVIKLGAGSVILPGVYIEGNAVIGENCLLKYVVLDKDVVVRPGSQLVGTAKNPIIIKRGEVV